MADLTIGEVKKILQLSLVNVDKTQSPPTITPLDLTGASSIQLAFVIADQNENPKPPVKTVSMAVVGPPSGGIVQYAFTPTDLVKPPDMGKDGVFRYSVQVTFVDGTILISAQDGRLTIKDDSVL